MPITIDSTTYDVPLLIVGREFEPLDKYAERTEDGKLQRELIGFYFNYSVQTGMSKNNQTDYDALMIKLTEPVEFHTITMPAISGTFETFECYFSGIRDEVYKWTDDPGGVTYSRRLTFRVIARDATRTP